MLAQSWFVNYRVEDTVMTWLLTAFYETGDNLDCSNMLEQELKMMFDTFGKIKQNITKLAILDG